MFLLRNVAKVAEYSNVDEKNRLKGRAHNQVHPKERLEQTKVETQRLRRTNVDIDRGSLLA
jgi:hypothetical protein